MALSVGARLGPYEILATLGAGGMGEVYRARDPRMGREVAIKVSAERFSDRFEREVRAVASLNHPNICQVYDVGPNYLVMELVEGQTLAERITSGPIRLEEALKIARQIGDALEAAHDKGIVHRDLKPANVKITREGVVKVLDFGLAKLADSATIREVDPTLTAKHATSAGIILGTAAYMSPEQARGMTVDKRADIWAFGVVLHEMLTGRRLFDGESVTDCLAAVLTKAPEWERVPARAQPLLRSCLEKDPKRRLRDIGDAWRLLEDAPVQTAPRTRLLWIAAAALAFGAGSGWLVVAWRATRTVDRPLIRLSVDLGPDAIAGLDVTATISPDGRRLVFPARGPDSKQQLATRLLDQDQITLLPGTEDGRNPFFSPDGQWIAFFSGTVLKKIPMHGGAGLTLGGFSSITPGADWSETGSIVVGGGVSDILWRLSDTGGSRQRLTKMGVGEVSHRWPQVLPGADVVLFTAAPAGLGMSNANIAAVSLKTGQTRILQRNGYYGRYLPSGHLVYLREGVLFGVKFDPKRLEVRGSPVPLLNDVAANPVTGGGQFDCSSTGTFVYSAGKSAAQAWQLSWIDSSGKLKPVMAAPGTYALPRISPDGRKLAFLANGGDIYVYDLERDTKARLTFSGDSGPPVWADDNKHIVFESGSGISWMRGDGAGDPQRLLESSNHPLPHSVSRDGRLAYFERNPETGADIWILPLDLSDPDRPKPGKAELFLRTAADESGPEFSPDGRWIAYRSNESGDNEIYVRPYPAGSGGKWQISSGGGLYARWSHQGRELFYETSDNRIMVMDYTAEGASFMPGKARLWSEKQLFYMGTSNLDLAPDGKRFVVLSMPEAAGGAKGSVHVTMLLNFFDELRRKLP